jgi:hypothetical protein
MNWIIVIHDHAFAIPDLKVKDGIFRIQIFAFLFYLSYCHNTFRGGGSWKFARIFMEDCNEMSARIFFRTGKAHAQKNV